MRIVLITAIYLVLALNVFSQKKASVDLQKNSILKIHCATNLLTFTLEQSGDKILNKTVSLIATQQGNKLYLSENKLSIRVKNFKSNNLIAQNEFYKLMAIDKFPFLNIHLNYFETDLDAKKQFNSGNALVDITITGVSKKFEIPVSISKKENIITLKGIKKMTIKDFGLIPPTAMIGLINVSEWIEIAFELYCKVHIDNSSETELKTK